MGPRESFLSRANILIFFTSIFTLGNVAGQGCVTKSYGENKIVCVCNATYCDNMVAPESLMQPGYFLQYTSTQSGTRLLPIGYQLTKSTIDKSKVWKINSQVQYQTILGFGGAVTDSVGINIGTVSQGTRQKIIENYFGSQGLQYSFVRVPMGGSDFSTRFYTYDDGPEDVTLSRFSLAEEDYKYKLPLLKDIKKIANPKIVATPWSPPTWMMESRNGTVGFTRLQPKFYPVLANYFVNFLQSYKMEGIDVWGVSPQNEPGDGYYVYFGINSCGYSPEEEANFIKILGPTLQDNGFGSVKIMNNEDQRTVFPDWPEKILSDATASKYVSGTALHWYYDDQSDANNVSILCNKYPDKFVLYTEASFIPNPGESAVSYGDWNRAEKLASDMIDVFKHCVVGWIDWNIVLDTTGGPTYLHNYLDSYVIINGTADEFYKQPIFYAMAHFSKFVPSGSRRIELSAPSNNTGIEYVGFLRPDKKIAVILLNRNDTKDIVLGTETEDYLHITVPGHSLHTIIL